MPSTAPRDAVAAAVTLTTSGENEPGFFTAFGAGAVPWSSSLNIDTPDSTRAATVVVPVSGGGLSIYSSSGGHMIVDFLGLLHRGQRSVVRGRPVRPDDTHPSGRHPHHRCPGADRVAPGSRHRRGRRRQPGDDRIGSGRATRSSTPPAHRCRPRPASTPCAPPRPCRTWPSRGPRRQVWPSTRSRVRTTCSTRRATSRARPSPRLRRCRVR